MVQLLIRIMQAQCGLDPACNGCLLGPVMLCYAVPMQHDAYDEKTATYAALCRMQCKRFEGALVSKCVGKSTRPDPRVVTSRSPYKNILVTSRRYLKSQRKRSPSCVIAAANESNDSWSRVEVSYTDLGDLCRLE